jgi:hypothetical protein
METDGTIPVIPSDTKKETPPEESGVSFFQLNFSIFSKDAIHPSPFPCRMAHVIE